MRNISFKGKDKKGHWFYGDLIQGYANNCYILCGFPDSENRIDPNDIHEVIPKSVSQFTGFYDKEKKPIYEKDWIEFYKINLANQNVPGSETYLEKCKQQVIFFNGCFMVNQECLDTLGLHSLKYVREALNSNPSDKTDAAGTLLNKSILGIKVINL